MEKILIFNNYYLPAKRYGGPVTSMVSVIENLGDEYDFYVLAANHEFGEDKPFENISPGWNRVGKAHVKYIDLKDIYWKPAAIEKILREEEPKLVWCAGILVPSDKWFIAAKCRRLNIPMLISPRGEVCSNAFHTKHLKKAVVAFIARALGVYRDVNFHGASLLEKQGLMDFYGVKGDRIYLVPNIPGLLHARDHVIEKQAGALKIVFLSRIQDTKNLLLAIEAACGLKGRVVFDIYGPKESADYWERCENAIKQAPPNVTIEYRGVVDPENVREVFSRYHCFLFPTITENFGHAIAEALSVSLPIIISRGATPWDEVDGVAGFAPELGNRQAFTEALRRLESMDQADYDRLVAGVKAFYDKKSDSNNAVAKHREMIKACIETKIN